MPFYNNLPPSEQGWCVWEVAVNMKISFMKKNKTVFVKNKFALTFEIGPSVTDGCGAYFYSAANEQREIKMFLQF